MNFGETSKQVCICPLGVQIDCGIQVFDRGVENLIYEKRSSSIQKGFGILWIERDDATEIIIRSVEIKGSQP
jgi:hypothetical protein